MVYSMSKTEISKFGELSSLYNFTLNPYPDQRFSRCPFCEEKTGQRKLPLFIHIKPNYPVVLNYTNRYCKQCDMLIGHKHEIEHFLTKLFMQMEPDAIGNKYFIIGTVEKKAWRENMEHPKSPAELRSQMHDFKMAHGEIRMDQGGWYGPGEKPKVRIPPESNEWIKR